MTKKELGHIVKKIKNRKWKKRGQWNSNILLSEIFGEGESTSSIKKIGLPFKKDVGIWLNSGDYLDLEKNWQEARKIIEGNYKKDKKYLSKYANFCLKEGNNLVDYSKRISKRKIKGVSNDRLHKNYEDLIFVCKDYMPFMFSLHVFDAFLTENFDSLLKSFIKDKKKSSSDYFDYKEALTLPTKKIYVLKERDDLQKIAEIIRSKKYKINSVKVKALIERHYLRYGWINMVMLEDGPYTNKYFLNKLEKIIKNGDGDFRENLKREAKIKRKNKEVMKEIKRYKDFYIISEMVQVFGFLRSFRLDVLYVALFNGWDIFEELAKRLKINAIDLKHLSSEEVGKALNKNLNYKKIIKERKIKNCSIMIGDKRYELTGRDCDFVSRYIKVNDNINISNKEIKGNIAYPGKIKGFCRILHKISDMKRIKKGDILVISMTDPNYIPAMEKAGAFVTDQGGILCHASIVSREMKKPCIIGTKIATQVLNDGDLIEVDANSGIIKIFNK
jgi:phosphoenolpyruvate synthase/pyruvate phosphate dikinase